MPMDRDAILFANEAFYRAFADRDYAAMEGLWARNLPVVCVHPGSAPLAGREDVMASWQAILGSDMSPAITCHGPAVYQYGPAAAVVCFEAIAENYLVATNLFVRQNGRWWMVHHQAGPTNDAPQPEAEPERPRPN